MRREVLGDLLRRAAIPETGGREPARVDPVMDTSSLRNPNSSYYFGRAGRTNPRHRTNRSPSR